MPNYNLSEPNKHLGLPKLLIRTPNMESIIFKITLTNSKKEIDFLKDCYLLASIMNLCSARRLKDACVPQQPLV
jgi:hypothetical protein